MALSPRLLAYLAGHQPPIGAVPSPAGATSQIAKAAWPVLLPDRPATTVFVPRKRYSPWPCRRFHGFFPVRVATKEVVVNFKTTVLIAENGVV
jgi:hypothetical protein